jgi:hypothetical protein
MMSCLLLSIPREIFFFFANYLLRIDEQNKLHFQYSNDWKNLMNTSKEYVEKWKRETQIIVLKPVYMKKFSRYLEFRDSILRNIVNPFEQLVLRFEYSPHMDLSTLSAVRKLDIVRGVVDNYPLMISDLVLYDCRINQLPVGLPVRSLKITRTFSPSATHTVDASCLKIMEEAIFSSVELHNYQTLAHLKYFSATNSTSIGDVTCFQNVRVLKLHSCPNITDVSCLGNVHDLELSDCGITDVSALGQVFKLNLSNCRDITDVSALGKVYDLNLANCPSIIDVTALGCVHTLNLNDCRGVTDISSLENVYPLSITGFKGTDVSALRSVVKLNLTYSSRDITDLSALTKVQELQIEKGPCVSHFVTMTNLRKLAIGAASGLAVKFQVSSGVEVFENLVDLKATLVDFLQETQPDSLQGLSLSHLKRIRRLEFHRCTLNTFPMTLNHLLSLTLMSCTGFTVIPAFPNLDCLELEGCFELAELEVEGSSVSRPVSTVKILGCDHLYRLRVFRKVSQFTIDRASRLEQLVVKQQINSLKITRSQKLTKIADSAPIIYREFE